MPATAVRSAALRAGLLLLAALALAALELPGRPSTLCGVRALTGLPCPLCGGTTAAVELGRLHPLAALAASPVAVLGAAAAVLAPLSPDRLRAAVLRTPVLLTVLAAGELWQLIRLP